MTTRNTETEKSPREIAEQIILREYGVTWKADNELIAAIEKALRDRDGRAANIAHSKLIEEDIEDPISKRIADGAHNSACLAIYEAIRGKS